MDVFLVLSGYLITALLVSEIDRTGRVDLPRFYRGARGSTLQALTTSGTPVLLVRDPPSPGVNVPVCLSRGKACVMDHQRVLHMPAFQAETAAAQGLAVTILDLTDRFCDAVNCPGEADGTIRYFDANHISATYAASLSSALGTALDPLVSARAP